MSNPWAGKIPWRREWLPTPVVLPRKFHGERNLVGYSPWDCKESDTTENACAHIHTDIHKDTSSIFAFQPPLIFNSKFSLKMTRISRCHSECRSSLSGIPDISLQKNETTGPSVGTHTHLWLVCTTVSSSLSSGLEKPISSVQFSRVQLFATPWLQHARLPATTNSRSFLKLMSIESVMPSNHLILSCALLLPQ